MSEATFLSPALSPSSASSPPPNPSPSPSTRRRPKSPIPRGYSSPPRKPLLYHVGYDILTPVNPSASAASLHYYALLASRLAQSGRLTDFLLISESILSGGPHPRFLAAISVRMVSQGIAAVLKQGGLDRVLDFMRGLERVGIRPHHFFHETSTHCLALECISLVEEGRLEEFVAAIETLSGIPLLFLTNNYSSLVAIYFSPRLMGL